VAKILTVANQKGGVGKTTTAINLSAALALAGRKTLLIDIDPQANATSGLGHKKDALVGSVNVLMRPERCPEAIAGAILPNLDLLPANPMLVNLERNIGEVQDRDARLKQGLALVTEKYDFIIIDCPPSLGLLTKNALRASEGVIVPIQTEYYAMEGLSQILSAVQAAQSPETGKPEIEGILFTMFDPRIALAREVVNEITGHFPDKVHSVRIPRDVPLGEAPGFGKCIFDYDLRCRGAMAYLELAKEVLNERH
jgi:chromosome partitioning protein